jgi:RND family efflux transporter MFP subunit
MRQTRWIALLLVCSAGVAGCNRAEPQVPPAAPPEVVVTYPITREVIDHEDFSGRTDAIPYVDLRARVQGYLAEVYFKDGDLVWKDEQLFLIDPRPYQAAVDQAEAQVRLAEAQAKYAEAEYRRNLTLSRKGAASQEDVDKTLAARDTANAQVRAAQADLERRRLDLDFTKVKTPVSGRIGRRQVDPGNLVKADDTLLATIVSLDPIYAYFEVDERTLLRVRRLVRAGKVKSAREAEIVVRLGLSDEEGFPHDGVIDFADNRVDPATGTLRLRAEFPNCDSQEAARRLRAVLSPDRWSGLVSLIAGARDVRRTVPLISPGLFARLRVPIGAPHPAILVPERALGTDQGQRFLYVVVAQTDQDGNLQTVAQYRPVTVGSLEGGWRVIAEGLRADEQVIVSGLQRVRRDAPVTPKPATEKELPPKPKDNGANARTGKAES